jgi:hypothetical protein
VLRAPPFNLELDEGTRAVPPTLKPIEVLQRAHDLLVMGEPLASLRKVIRVPARPPVDRDEAAELLTSLQRAYDFRVEVAPLGRENVVFSTDAMRNFVKLFSGGSIDGLPGIANWLAFGGVSRWLGYNVDYAGISAYSTNGSILVETLDPEEDNIEDRRANEHYILFGPRFRMPIVSKNYPLLIDAPAISNFVRQVMAQLQAMAENAEEQKEENQNEKKPTPCLPPEL